MIIPLALILSLETVSGHTPGWFGNIRGGHLSFSGADALSGKYFADKKEDTKAFDVKSTPRIRGGHLSFSGADALSDECLANKKEDTKVIDVESIINIRGGHLSFSGADALPVEYLADAKEDTKAINVKSTARIRGGHLSFSGADALSNECLEEKKEDTKVINVKSTSTSKKWSDSDFEEEDHFFHALVHNNDERVATNVSSKKSGRFMPDDYMMFDEAFRICGGGPRRGGLRPRALSDVAYAYGHLTDERADEEVINAKSASKNRKKVSSKKEG